MAKQFEVKGFSGGRNIHEVFATLKDAKDYAQNRMHSSASRTWHAREATYVDGRFKEWFNKDSDVYIRSRV